MRAPYQSPSAQNPRANPRSQHQHDRVALPACGPAPCFPQHRRVPVALHHHSHSQRALQSPRQRHFLPSRRTRPGTATPVAATLPRKFFLPTNSRANSTICFTGASADLLSTFTLFRANTFPSLPTSAPASFVPPKSTANTHLAAIRFFAFLLTISPLLRPQNPCCQNADPNRSGQWHQHPVAHSQSL